LEEFIAVSPTTVQDWLRRWRQEGLLAPAKSGQRIRSWQLRQPWLAWVIGQLEREQ
jgi:transposase